MGKAPQPDCDLAEFLVTKDKLKEDTERHAALVAAVEDAMKCPFTRQIAIQRRLSGAMPIPVSDLGRSDSDSD